MSGYVAGGWAVAAAILAGYSWRTVRRGRVLTRQLRPRRDGSDR